MWGQRTAYNENPKQWVHDVLDKTLHDCSESRTDDEAYCKINDFAYGYELFLNSSKVLFTYDFFQTPFMLTSAF